MMMMMMIIIIIIITVRYLVVVEGGIEHKFFKNTRVDCEVFLRQKSVKLRCLNSAAVSIECMQHVARAERDGTTKILTKLWLNSESAAKELLRS
jgi:hypothetical protein